MDFFLFWTPYPKKQAFKRTKIIWEALSTEQKDKAVKALPLHIKMWSLENRQPQFIPMPFSWLEGERWEDEITFGEKNNGKFSVNQYITKKFANSMDRRVTPEVFGDVHGKIYPLLRRA